MLVILFTMIYYLLDIQTQGKSLLLNHDKALLLNLSLDFL